MDPRRINYDETTSQSVAREFTSDMDSHARNKEYFKRLKEVLFLIFFGSVIGRFFIDGSDNVVACIVIVHFDSAFYRLKTRRSAKRKRWRVP